jgi:hypothetical protein
VIAVSIQLASPWAAFAQQPINNDLTALEGAADNVFLPPTATSAQAGTTQSGTRSWDFFLGNRSQTPVTNATVTVESGYNPSLFPGVSSFPVTATQANLTPGQEFSAGPLQSSIPVSFTLGYDSTRTVSPLVVPVGGTQQTVIITVTPIDARYASPLDGFVFFNINLNSNVPGVSTVSTTNPNNLNQGETIQTFTALPFALFQWRLGSPQLNKQYTFTAVLNVPNPFGVPFEYRPDVGIRGERQTFVCQVCPGSTVTVNDPTLDGNVPGSGAVTFSVAETNHTWTSTHSDSFDVDYAGTSQTQVTPVTIVVKPGDGQPAPINPKSNGKIPVAILSTGSFDATTVDPTTVKFGVLGSEASSTQTSLEDVNGDGKLDMVLHFPTQNTGIVCGTTSVTLTGQTTSGQAISGTAPIRTVGCG